MIVKILKRAFLLPSYIFKKRIPLSIATGSVVFGVTQFIGESNLALTEKTHEQIINEYEYKINKLESDLSTIKRGLNKAGMYDLKKIICKKAEMQPFSDRAVFFEKDSFYALPKLDGWKYEKTTDAHLLEDISNSDLGTPLKSLFGKFPIHLWKSKKEYTIKEDGDKLTLFSYILLKKIPKDRADEYLRSMVAIHRWSKEQPHEKFSQDFLDLSKDTSIVDPVMKRIALDDFIGFMTATLVFDRLTNPFNLKLKYHRLNEIQLSGDISHMTFCTKYKVPKHFWSNEEESFYLHSDYVLLSTNDEIYLLVSCHQCNVGYNRLSLMRASPVVNCQFTT